MLRGSRAASKDFFSGGSVLVVKPRSTEASSTNSVRTGSGGQESAIGHQDSGVGRRFVLALDSGPWTLDFPRPATEISWPTGHSALASWQTTPVLGHPKNFKNVSFQLRRNCARMPPFEIRRAAGRIPGTLGAGLGAVGHPLVGAGPGRRAIAPYESFARSRVPACSARGAWQESGVGKQESGASVETRTRTRNRFHCDEQ